MEFDEFRQRLDAARSSAALMRLEAVEILATNVDLTAENDEAFARNEARQLGQDRRLGVPPDPIRAAHAERSQTEAHSLSRAAELALNSSANADTDGSSRESRAG